MLRSQSLNAEIPPSKLQKLQQAQSPLRHKTLLLIFAAVLRSFYLTHSLSIVLIGTLVKRSFVVFSLGGVKLGARKTAMNDKDATMDETLQTKEWNPHAFHRNLPPHHMDDDGVPFISKFAEDKARKIVALAESLELNETLFVRNDDAMDVDMNDIDDEEDDDHALPKDYTLVRLHVRRFRSSCVQSLALCS